MAPSSGRILMVEDDPEQAMLFAMLLKSAGYNTTNVVNAEAALAALTQSSYDLLLADRDLPVMKGEALITFVKAEYPALKTLLFSNHANVDKIAAACGADAWFRKSDNIFNLRQIIADLRKQPV